MPGPSASRRDSSSSALRGYRKTSPGRTPPMGAGRSTAMTSSWPGSMSAISSSTPKTVSPMFPVSSVTDVSCCYRQRLIPTAHHPMPIYDAKRSPDNPAALHGPALHCIGVETRLLKDRELKYYAPVGFLRHHPNYLSTNVLPNASVLKVSSYQLGMTLRFPGFVVLARRHRRPHGR